MRTLVAMALALLALAALPVLIPPSQAPSTDSHSSMASTNSEYGGSGGAGFRAWGGTSDERVEGSRR